MSPLLESAIDTLAEHITAMQRSAADAASVAMEIADELENITTYWTAPSYAKEEADGVEFFWPNGTFIALVQSLGRWYLETEDDMYVLISTRVSDLAKEIDLILKAKGYDDKLKVDYIVQK